MGRKWCVWKAREHDFDASLREEERYLSCNCDFEVTIRDIGRRGVINDEWAWR
jgi:hypothetical protein